MSIVKNILDGGDLFIVLENRFGRHYKESYNLDTLIIYNDVFWGKFSSVHSPMGHGLIKTETPLAYAYNNFSDVVCTMNYADRIQRYCSTKMYSRIQFKTKGNFKLAIDGVNSQKTIDHSILNDAVENALKIKLIICEENNLIQVVPVHTVELYEDQRDVGIDTNFEAVPSLLYNFEYFYRLEVRLQEVLDSEGTGIASTDYIEKSQFTLISYVIIGSDIYKRVLNTQGQVEDIAIPYKWFKVYCEA